MRVEDQERVVADVTAIGTVRAGGDEACVVLDVGDGGDDEADGFAGVPHVEVVYLRPEVGDRMGRIGVTTCRLLGIAGRELRLDWPDAPDGSPVLDVRPGSIDSGQCVATLVASFADRMERRDWDGFRKVLHPEVVYELPQTRERIRGRDSYVTFNTEYPGDWHITPQVVLGNQQFGALLFEWTTDGSEPSLAVAFFEADDGRVRD